jgi:chromodomain-helicase-DNA-binding protein 7
MAEDDLDLLSVPSDTQIPASSFLPTTLENGDSLGSVEPSEPLPEGEEETPSKPQPRVKSKTPSRVKPNKTLLQFSKKKRKRSNSEGSENDMDATPPPSPTEEESGIEKRRSGRNTGTKRKKYVDDVQMAFSDEDKLPKDISGVASAAMLEDILGPIKDPENPSGEIPNGDEVVQTGQAGPNYAFIDPTAEDTMIVQYILTSRTGTRELEDSEVSHFPCCKFQLVSLVG